MTLREKTYRQFFARSDASERLSGANRIMVIVIIAAVTLTILSTEAAFRTVHRTTFILVEFAFGVIFTVEYVARVWAIAEEAGEHSVLARRLRFMASPMALLDLFVVLATLSPFFVSDAAMLRLVRLLRLAALAKFGRFSRALQELGRALAERRYELFVTMALALMLLLFGATALYWAERDVQPGAFGSIPRALWWAIITLTTVGYGDVSPITPVGKFLASIVALGGIGLVAMPTGIMASAFSEAMQRRRDAAAVQGNGPQV
ncbi:MAG: ion transporter [Sphingomonadaceae bacterium]|nr:ion transporter [Sphingomonadaceae bacterium]